MTFFAFIVLTLLSYGPWEFAGPSGGDINAPIQSLTNADHLWAYSGLDTVQVVHSNDGGLNWKVISEFPGGTASDMVVTADGKMIIVGNNCTWNSIDAGRTWKKMKFPGMYMASVQAHSSNPGEFFGTGRALFDGKFGLAFMHSTDGGLSYTTTSLPLKETAMIKWGMSIAVAESDPSIMLIGAFARVEGDYLPYLYKSTDGGSSFIQLSIPAPSTENKIYGVAIHPVNPSIMLAGGANTLYRSEDAGDTWVKVTNQPHSYGMIFSRADHNLVLAGAISGSYISTDMGENWGSSSGLTGSGTRWVVPSWDDPSIAFASSIDGFFRSTDGGVSWSASNSGLRIGRMTCLMASEGWIYSYIKDCNIYKAHISDLTEWQIVKTPQDCGDFCDLASDNSGTILALEGVG